MENKVTIDENSLKNILDQEARNITGKVCKRFELALIDEKNLSIIKTVNDIKAQVKELIYEHSRDLRTQILNSANKIHIINVEETKK